MDKESPGEPIATWCDAHWNPLIPRIEAGEVNGIILSIFVMQRFLHDLFTDFPGGNVSALSLAEGPGCCYFDRDQRALPRAVFSEFDVLVEASRTETLKSLEPGRLDSTERLEAYLDRVREEMVREGRE